MDVKTILLVIADAARRAALGDALRLESHSVLVAASPDDALAVADTVPRAPDLIVTDQRLDAGTGRTLAATVARRRPGARVLLLMGFGAISAPLPLYYLDVDTPPSSVARVATRILGLSG